jgi:hypothetical protein
MPRPQGTIRQSQLITTFGPGAMVDLPRHSVVVGGLEEWNLGPGKRRISEDRLVAKIQELLKIPAVPLFAPPAESDDPRAVPAGITAWQFPEWFIAQHEVLRGSYRRRPLVHQAALVPYKGGWRYEDPQTGRKRPVVPIRFVQGCINGHLSDIDWIRFVHEGVKSECARPLWVEERGTSGDIRDVFILCECGAFKSMSAAAARGTEVLGFCRGQRPWLGNDAWERCGGPDGKAQPNRLLLRNASDAYFSQVLRVISIPDADANLRLAVARVYEDFLSGVSSIQELRYERKKAKVNVALDGFDEAAILAEIQRRQGNAQGPVRKIKQAEIETLMASTDEIGSDVPGGVEFFARRMAMPTPRPKVLEPIDRVVLVHRLREVMALVGFTRFEAEMPDIDGELALDVRRAALAREVSWLPAVENRGEGFFVAFRRAAIDEWLARPAVKARGHQLVDGFTAWLARRKTAKDDQKPAFPGTHYVFLHSLAHLLITSVSLECGYSSSSIRERVYVGDGGYGILLYTGTPDAEGTLGGLVEVARGIERHLKAALDLARLCSNDPVCAQHDPSDPHEERFLNGAACHGCLLIAEPSCERRNEFLDRALVVATVDATGAEFFRE